MATPTDQPTDLTKTTPAAPTDVIQAPQEEQRFKGWLVGFPVKAGQSGPVAYGTRVSTSITHDGPDQHSAFAITPVGRESALLGIYVDAIEEDRVVLGVLNAPTQDTDATVMVTPW
jgi:hypothetical protein